MSRTGISAKGGFTIIELLVVIAIMALISGIVVVAMGSSLRDARMHSACRVVASALNYARSYAVTSRCEARVVVDQGKSVYVEELLEEPGEEPRWRELTTSGGKRRDLPEGISITWITKSDSVEEEDWVEFTKLGQGEDAIIELSDTEKVQRYVVVDPITGRCRVQTRDEIEQDQDDRSQS